MSERVTIACEKCLGTGKIDVDVDDLPCGAEIVIGSESIGCYAQHGHPGEPHMALLASPCAGCGQYDEHDATCAVYLLGPAEDYSIGWYAWNDGDVALTIVDDEVGQLWRDHHQPSSPHARKAVPTPT